MLVKSRKNETGFCHACFKSKNRRNIFLAFCVGLGWIEEMRETRQYMLNNFVQHF